MTEPEGVAWLGAFLERQERAREEVTEQHAAMTDGQRRRRVLVEYHCTAGRPCLLLRIFASDDYGPAFYRPPYILTEERNLRASNEDGRAANTTDGANHWREGVGPWVTADGIESTAGWSLNCRHVDVSVRWADIDADVRRAQPGAPVRRRILRVSSQDFRRVALESVTQHRASGTRQP